MGMYDDHDREEHCFVIPMQAIMRRLGSYGPSAEGPSASMRESLWADWGKDTRYMPTYHFSIPTRGSRLCFVTVEVTPEGQRLNTPVILNFAIPGHTIPDSDSDSPMLEGLTGSVTAVRKPTAFETEVLYEDGFLTTAPYEQVLATSMSWPVDISWRVSLGEHSILFATPTEYVQPTAIAHSHCADCRLQISDLFPLITSVE